MKKMILNLSLILTIVGSVGILKGEELEECQNEQDKISGCVEKKHIGGLLIKTPYKNGKKEGIEKWYGANGNLYLSTPYKNGKREGIRKSYYRNGNLISEAPYKNDKKEGIWKMYHESGNLAAEVLFKNDKLEGIGEFYYKNGDLLATITYKNNKPISGKCGDGKALTEAHLHDISIDINNISTICNK